MELILAFFGLSFIGGLILAVLFVAYDDYKEHKEASRKNK